MTIAPPKLLDLAARLKSQIGPFFLGIVGDKNHKYGYHLGAYEVLASDYSRQLRRDKDGITKYGGYYAAAIDIGMGWKASRDWLKWLVKQCQAGKFPDVREVIGSFDGKTCFYYDNTDKTVYKRTAKDHITHSHVGFFRDAIMRDQRGILADWRKDGRPKPPPPPPPIVVPPIELPTLPTLPNPIPVPPKVPESGQVTEPTPVEPPENPAEPSTPAVPAPQPTPPVEPSPAPTEPPAGAPACPGAAARAGCLAGLAGAAWIIKRRNQLGAKDEGSK